MKLPKTKSLAKLIVFSLLLFQSSSGFAQISHPLFDSLLIEIKLNDNTKVKGIVTKQLDGPRAVFEAVDGRTFIISKDNVDAMEIDLKDLNRIIQEEEKTKRIREKQLNKSSKATYFSRNTENNFAFAFDFNPSSNKPSHNIYIKDFFPELTVEENEISKPVFNATLFWFLNEKLSVYGCLGFQTFSQNGKGTQAISYNVTTYNLSVGAKYFLQDLNETKNLKSFFSLKTGKLITTYKKGNNSVIDANHGNLQDYGFENKLSELNSPFYFSFSCGAEHFFSSQLSVFAEYSITKQWTSVTYNYSQFFKNVYSFDTKDYNKKIEISEWYGEPKIGFSLYF